MGIIKTKNKFKIVMAQYIDKDALVAEIERRMQELRPTNTHKMQVGEKVDRDVLMWLNALTWVKTLLENIDTLEMKDTNEALRTEYEKGRVDVIADTLSWLANVWPQYCSNPTIIDAYKEGVVKD